MPPTELLAPRDQRELVAALARTTDASRLVAGATDWMLGRRAGGNPPDLLIDLSHLHGFRAVGCADRRIRVGALSTCSQLQCDPVLATHARCLAQAAARVGSVQIRNVATIGGNVANASPCADLVTALVALEATATVIDGAGRATERPIAQLFASAGGSALRRDEAILEFAFAGAHPDRRSGFAKLGVRSSVAVARLNAALVVDLDPDGATIAAARLAIGSLAPAAFLAGEVAAPLVGTRIDAACPEEFAHRCLRLVDERIPERSSRAYKRLAIRGLAADLWSAAGAGTP
ncbi:MAG: FAD binding domain-containing protein [Gammaproteobacteria bacterium]|nr:FAD binding domain-containing protein [Gammaproteobacteria bacterium]